MSEPAAASVRAFLALELGAPLHDALASTLAGPLVHLRGLKRVRPEGLHLTLRFLGEARPDQLAQVAAALEPEAAGCESGDAEVTGLGVFPGRGAPRVLWVGLALPPGVLALQAACERAARAAGFAPEPRPFAPHVTLGRWRQHAPPPHLPAVQLPAARLDALILFRSELGSGGARYTPLQRLPLGATATRPSA